MQYENNSFLSWVITNCKAELKKLRASSLYIQCSRQHFICLAAKDDVVHFVFSPKKFARNMETCKAKHEAISKSICCLHSKSLFWLPISCIGQPSCPSSSVYHPKIVPGMVTIKETIAIQYQEEKTIGIPDNLILHHGGKKYLKFRPTCYAIIAILLGHSPKKNASLSNHELLTQLVNARNTEMNKFQTETPEDEAQQALFDQEDDGLTEPAKKKLCKASSPFVATINVCDKPVECLVSGQRPARSDLAVLLEPSHLEAVICQMRPGDAKGREVSTNSPEATK